MTARPSHDSPSPPSVPMPTPFSRIHASGHGINRIAQQLARNDRLPQWARDEAVKIVLLSADIPEDIDAVKQLVGCYQRDISELRNEALWREQERNAEMAMQHSMQIPLTREPHRAASGE